MNINKGHVVCVQACTSKYMESNPNQSIAEDILENQRELNYQKEITEENTRYVINSDSQQIIHFSLPLISGTNIYSILVDVSVVIFKCKWLPFQN